MTDWEKKFFFSFYWSKLIYKVVFGERIFFFFFFFLLFRATLVAFVTRLGVKAELQLTAYTTATATQDPSHICYYPTAHGNTGSLTHWARPWTEPASSWILVGFVNRWAMTETPRILNLCSLHGRTYKKPCKVAEEHKGKPAEKRAKDIHRQSTGKKTHIVWEGPLSPPGDFIIYLFCLLSFYTPPMACGGSQARSQIGAVAASLYHSHSHMGSELHLCNLPHSSWQHRTLNPLERSQGSNLRPHGS